MNKEFVSSLVPADGDTPKLVLRAEPGSVTVLREVQIVVRLVSIDEAPTISTDPMLTQSAREALFWNEAVNSQHKKMVTWRKFSPSSALVQMRDFLIFARTPDYVEDGLARLTGLGELRMQAGSEIHLSIAATNSGLLSGSDVVTIYGQYDEY
jgi:hypothetical protein